MTELEEAGWRKTPEKTVDKLTNKDIKDVFILVDKDKSGEVSRTVGHAMHGVILSIDTTFRKPGLQQNFLRKSLG